MNSNFMYKSRPFMAESIKNTLIALVCIFGGIVYWYQYHNLSVNPTIKVNESRSVIQVSKGDYFIIDLGIHSNFGRIDSINTEVYKSGNLISKIKGNSFEFIDVDVDDYGNYEFRSTVYTEYCHGQNISSQFLIRPPVCD